MEPLRLQDRDGSNVRSSVFVRVVSSLGRAGRPPHQHRRYYSRSHSARFCRAASMELTLAAGSRGNGAEAQQAAMEWPAFWNPWLAPLRVTLCTNLDGDKDRREECGQDGQHRPDEKPKQRRHVRKAEASVCLGRTWKKKDRD